MHYVTNFKVDNMTKEFTLNARIKNSSMSLIIGCGLTCHMLGIGMLHVGLWYGFQSHLPK